MRKSLKRKKPKLVVDTNIFISALLGSPACLKIRDAFKEEKIDLIVSPALMEEYESVSKREKLAPYMDAKDRDELLNRIQNDAIKVFPKEKVTVCRDPKDNRVLECAQAGKAGFIVTGDNDLLVLKKFKGARILPPKKFIKRLHSSRA